jgi:hypothetical protein
VPCIEPKYKRRRGSGPAAIGIQAPLWINDALECFLDMRPVARYVTG